MPARCSDCGRRITHVPTGLCARWADRRLRQTVVLGIKPRTLAPIVDPVDPIDELLDL